MRRHGAAAFAVSIVLASTLPAQEGERSVPRAVQDRDIVYFLQAPESHSFRLHHDYTEAREGVDKYVNVVRKGSAASTPSAVLLDTGEALTVETLRGEEITKAKVDLGEPVRPDSEAVVVRFPPVKKGRSSRIRITETYRDAASYRLEGDTLAFDRTFGRPRNAVVLPAGWTLASCSIPATISETPEGRIRLFFVNGRPDEIAVSIRAKRRPAR
jgi:hypothetical protein